MQPGGEERAVPWSQGLCALAPSALASAAAFVVGCAPWYAAQFPSTGTLDTLDQLRQAAGTAPLNDAHPIALTLILRLFGVNPTAFVVGQHLLLAITVGVAFATAAVGFTLPSHR